MILKMVIGRGARGVLDYISTAHKTDKPNTMPMFTNMAGKTARELAKEVAALRKSKPRLGKAAAHLILSQDPSDRTLNEKEWSRALQLALQAHGAGSAPYAAYLHTDKEHQHLHCFFLRVRHDGTVVSDSQSYKKNEAAARRIEAILRLNPPKQKTDLDRIGTSDKTTFLKRKAHRKGIEMISTKQLAELVRKAEKAANSPEHFQELLHAVGVEVEFRKSGNDGPVAGWKLRPAGVDDWVKGSEITADRSFAWSKVAARKGWAQDKSTPTPFEFLADEPDTEKTEEEHQIEAIHSSLTALIQVCTELSIHLFEVILKFINRVLALAGLKCLIDLPERAERVSQARVKSLPAEPISADAQNVPKAPNYAGALKVIRLMTDSIKTNNGAAVGEMLAKVDERVVPAADRCRVVDFVSAQGQTPAQRVEVAEKKRAEISQEWRTLNSRLNAGRLMRHSPDSLKQLEDQLLELTARRDEITNAIREMRWSQMTSEERAAYEIEVAVEEARQIVQGES